MISDVIRHFDLFSQSCAAPLLVAMINLFINFFKILVGDQPPTKAHAAVT
jgi:hypothetical protein